MDFLEHLSKATSEIERIYFQLPVAGLDYLKDRERVYCYELYHRLRAGWPFQCNLSIAGEVDKSGQPLFRDGVLANVKPDFLVHRPGDMEGNHTVMEVKSLRTEIRGMSKDLKNLTAFRKHAKYRSAVYLIYGQGEIKEFKDKIQTIVDSDSGHEIDISNITFMWHAEVSKAAVPIQMNEHI